MSQSGKDNQLQVTSAAIPPAIAAPAPTSYTATFRVNTAYKDKLLLFTSSCLRCGSAVATKQFSYDSNRHQLEVQVALCPGCSDEVDPSVWSEVSGIEPLKKLKRELSRIYFGLGVFLFSFLMAVGASIPFLHWLLFLAGATFLALTPRVLKKVMRAFGFGDKQSPVRLESRTGNVATLRLSPAALHVVQDENLSELVQVIKANTD